MLSRHDNSLEASLIFADYKVESIWHMHEGQQQLWQVGQRQRHAAGGSSSSSSSSIVFYTAIHKNEKTNILQIDPATKAKDIIRRFKVGISKLSRAVPARSDSRPRSDFVFNRRDSCARVRHKNGRKNRQCTSLLPSGDESGTLTRKRMQAAL